MNQTEFDAYFRTLLRIDDFRGDPSQNGIQVENGGGGIVKIAFAVDACLDAILAAENADANLLVVHHGLFWRDSPLAVSSHFRRLKALFDAGIALYACHLPLDAHETLGNNAGIARKIGAEICGRFGEFHGVQVGFLTEFSAAKTLDEICATFCGNAAVKTLPFGPKSIRRVAICSGGAADFLHDAAASKADLFITGEIEHATFHAAKEAKISVVALGHYASEVFGVQSLMQKTAADTGVETVFLDIPTGL